MKNGTKDSLKIAFDYQIFMRQQLGGISRVYDEVNSRLAGDSRFRLEYPVWFSQNHYFKDIIPVNRLAKNKVINYFLRLLNKLRFVAYLLCNRDCDIVHATYYSGYFYPFLPKKTKYVMYVHDCIHELYAKNTLGNRRIKYLKKRAVKRADVIITHSHHTKEDVMRIFGVPEEKIQVIYPGCGVQTGTVGTPDMGSQVTGGQTICSRIANLPEKYVLFVGNRADYKNFATFVSGIKKVFEVHEDVCAVCVGTAFDPEEERALVESGIRDRVFQLRASDEELVYLYRHALCFVYPSFYEGFGIPILEAFQNECPVILSEASCFPEVGGDAALYFQPESADELAEKIECLMTDEYLRKSLIEQGTVRCRDFSWDNTAEQTAEVYLNVVTGSY